MKLPSELEYLKNVKMWVFILFFSLRPDVNCLVGDHWFQGQYLLTLKTKLHLTLKAALNKMPKKYFLKVNKQKRTYLKNKLLINMPLCNAGLKVGILQEAEQKFIDKLEYQGKKKRKSTFNYSSSLSKLEWMDPVKHWVLTCMWGHETSRVGSSSSGSKSGLSLGGSARKIFVQICRKKKESQTQTKLLKKIDFYFSVTQPTSVFACFILIEAGKVYLCDQHGEAFYANV